VLSSQGAFNGLALLVSVAGLGLLTYAGSLRDAHGKQQQRDEDVQPLLMVSGADDASAGSAKPRRSGSFTSGLLMCILSGVLSSCLNLSFTFGKHIHNAAVRHGNSKVPRSPWLCSFSHHVTVVAVPALSCVALCSMSQTTPSGVWAYPRARSPTFCTACTSCDATARHPGTAESATATLA
jgi:hypothetical protein